MIGAIMMTCAVLLYPTGAEPTYNTTVIRINKRPPEACRIAAGKYNARTGKNVCTCQPVRIYPKSIPSLKDPAK